MSASETPDPVCRWGAKHGDWTWGWSGKRASQPGLGLQQAARPPLRHGPRGSWTAQAPQTTAYPPIPEHFRPVRLRRTRPVLCCFARHASGSRTTDRSAAADKAPVHRRVADTSNRLRSHGLVHPLFRSKGIRRPTQQWLKWQLSWTRSSVQGSEQSAEGLLPAGEMSTGHKKAGRGCYFTLQSSAGMHNCSTRLEACLLATWASWANSSGRAEPRAPPRPGHGHQP